MQGILEGIKLTSQYLTGERYPYSISKKDGNRHSNVFKKYVDILMYCKNRKLFGIHMTAILVL